MTFTVVYRPTRSRFPADATPAEMDAISSHFEAESIETAAEFARRDPAALAGVFTTELREFRIIYPNQ